MTEEQIELIKKTWKGFRGVSPTTVADLFYTKLFTDNPALRKMFPVNMEQQYQKMVDMLNALVSRLGKLYELTDEITAMAKRHVQYGVRPAHYKMVGAALLWTLQKGLGEDWNEDVKDAWSTCYKILSDMMINASVLPANK